MRNLEKGVSTEGKVMRSPSQVRLQLDLFVNGLGVCLHGALEVLLGLSWLLDACKELWNDTVTSKSIQREARFLVRGGRNQYFR